MTAPAYTLHHGDALQVLKTLPSESVHVCVTSPPYYGLRDYGTAAWDGGDPDCDHQVGRFTTPASDKQRSNNGSGTLQARDVCPRCGARRVDQQIGLEDTPEAYVSRLVDVFREVRRVLHKTGTLWLNLGSSYSGSGGAGGDYNEGGLREGQPRYAGRSLSNFKPKDMIPIPWMVAMALQQDGWWLRADIIWHKRAPMPASVRDRPTPAHEYVFLLSKSADYFYDATAIAEPAVGNTPANVTHKHQNGAGIILGRKTEPNGGLMSMGAATTRNRRSVWTLGPEPYAEAHFATMPTKLVEPCILAGSSGHGCCSQCGAPWQRVTERVREHGLSDTSFPKTDGLEAQNGHKRLHQRIKAARAAGEPHDNPLGGTVTTGWVATCTCGADVIPCTVLDPFAGSGTTLAVALKHGRSAIGIDLNANYIDLAHDRIGRTQPLLLDIT